MATVGVQWLKSSWINSCLNEKRWRELDGNLTGIWV